MRFPISFFLLLFSFAVVSQTIPYQQYGVENGLGHSIVYSAFQDRQGYMWFSTDRGLSKFDGIHFTNYTTADGLPTNYIISATQTNDGVLWLATFGSGVYKYQNGKFTSCPADKNDKLSFVNTVLADKKDRIWIFDKGRITKDLWYIENNIYKKFSINKYTNDSAIYFVYDVLAKSDGSVLFATNKGVFAFKEDKLTSLIKSDSIIYAMDEDKWGNLWLGSEGKVIEVSADNKIRSISNEFIRDKHIHILKADYEGRLWISDYPHHLFVINETNGKQVYEDDIPVNYFFADKENNMWATTFGRGVLCFNYPDITNYTIKDGLIDDIILGVTEDNKGKIWIAGLRGISYLNDDKIEKSGIAKFIKRDEIFSFIIDNNEDLLYASANNVMVVKNGITKTFGLSDRVRSLYKDTDGKIWLALNSGIACYQNDSVFYPKELSVLENKKNLVVMRDSKRKLWFGTNDGAFCYDDKTIIHYTTSEGLTNNIVNCIWEDSRNRIWFGTDEGISVFSNGKCVNDSLLKSLNNTTCTSLMGDNKGNVWIGTNNGLFIDDGEKIIRFDNRTGIAGIEVQSLFIDRRNCLWVGTVTGLSKIDLNMYSDRTNSYPPQIYIQSVRVNNNIVGKKDSTSLSLNYYENNLRVSYQGLCFKSPLSLLYEYKLAGGSGTWIKTQSSSIEFSSLPPGHYKFLVKAINSDGTYSKVPASFSFTILPPFWMTAWFVAIEVLLIMTFIIVLFRWRLHLYKQKAQVRLEKQRMEEELLSAKKALDAYTSSMEEKNQLLEQFKADIDKLKILKAKEIDEDRVEQLEHLNKTTILTEEDWDKFKKLFEQVYKGFLIRLKEKMPDLTQAEIRLMCLTKLRLDTKQMAGILGVSFDAIRMTRHRLRKKLGLTEEKDIDDVAETI